MKNCRRCGENKPKEDFSAHPTARDGLHSYCKTCVRSYQRDWMTPERRRREQLKRKYGITPEEYDALLSQQGGACAICRSKRPGGNGKWMNVDHCHTTGLVRGLLCWGCNTGVGKFRDDPMFLRRAANYLEQFCDATTT